MRRYIGYNDDYEKWGVSKTSAIRGLFHILGRKHPVGILTHLMMLAKLCFVMELKFVAQSIAENVNMFITHKLFLQLHPNAKNQQNGVILQEIMSTSFNLMY